MAQYYQLLRQTQSTLEAVAAEIDRDVISNFHQRVPIELRHDVVPLMNAINNAIREVQVSLSLKY